MNYKIYNKEQILNLAEEFKLKPLVLDTLLDDREYVIISLKELGSTTDINRVVRYKGDDYVHSLFISNGVKVAFTLPRTDDNSCQLNIIKTYDSEDLQLIVTRHNPKAFLPKQETGNAGMDIFLPEDTESITINPHSVELIATGLKFKIPKGYYLQVADRGSIGSLGLTYTSGIIDNNYLGEVFLSLANITNKTITITSSVKDVIKTEEEIFIPTTKAIAQLILHKYVDASDLAIHVVEPEDFAKYTSNRNDSKLGSTDK